MSEDIQPDNYFRLRVTQQRERARQAQSYESQSRFDPESLPYGLEAEVCENEAAIIAQMIGCALLAFLLLAAVAAGGFALGVSYQVLHTTNN